MVFVYSAQSGPVRISFLFRLVGFLSVSQCFPGWMWMLQFQSGKNNYVHLSFIGFKIVSILIYTVFVCTVTWFILKYVVKSKVSKLIWECRMCLGLSHQLDSGPFLSIVGIFGPFQKNYQLNLWCCSIIIKKRVSSKLDWLIAFNSSRHGQSIDALLCCCILCQPFDRILINSAPSLIYKLREKIKFEKNESVLRFFSYSKILMTNVYF